MPKRIPPLSDMQINKAKPRDKQYTLFDGGGLFLLVTPTGGKLWRFKYPRPGGDTRNTLSFGAYPEISLSEAREKRQEARTMLVKGVDPSNVRQACLKSNAGGNSFEVIGREWHRTFSGKWTEKYGAILLLRLEKDVFVPLGASDINDVKPGEILAALRAIQNRGALDQAHRTLGMIEKIFRYAIATNRAEQNPAIHLRGALPPITFGHQAAITDPAELGQFLKTVEGYVGSVVVHAAMRLLPLVFVRPGELRMAEWSEFDLDAALWDIPAERMKMKKPHLVPLSRQAVAILRGLHPFTRHSKYVFPCHRSPLRCMSDNAINAGFRRMGLEKSLVCAHGFRATARTILDEVLEYRTDWIEHQLAHEVKDPNGRAYNRTKYLPQRREMMQRWADYLDGLTGI